MQALLRQQVLLGKLVRKLRVFINLCTRYNIRSFINVCVCRSEINIVRKYAKIWYFVIIVELRIELLASNLPWFVCTKYKILRVELFYIYIRYNIVKDSTG